MTALSKPVPVAFPSRDDKVILDKDAWWHVDLTAAITQGGATRLVRRCMRELSWNEAMTRNVLTAYQQFLTLVTKLQDYKTELIRPSRLVDHMWCLHILDVVHYAHDCMLLCERVVCRNNENGGKHEYTRELLERFFPAFDKEVWEKAEAVGQRQLEPTQHSLSIRTLFGKETQVIVHCDRTLAYTFVQQRSSLAESRLLFRGVQVDLQRTPQELGLQDGDVLYDISK